MSVIEETQDVHTMIVVFTVDPADQEAMVQKLRGVAADHARHVGFVSCAVHRSLDGTRVAEYIQWRTRADMQAMADTDAGRAHIAEASRIADAHAYEVVSVIEVPVPADG